MPPNPKARQSALNLLLPSFRVRVERVLERMKARGFDPIAWETLRTPERAEELKKSGTSRNGKNSMHCSADGFSAAVDVISASKKWDDPKFFVALAEEGQAEGLTSGIDWDRNPKTSQTFDDRPHLQAIPIQKQAAFRALKTTLERDAFVERYLASAKRVA